MDNAKSAAHPSGSMVVNVNACTIGHEPRDKKDRAIIVFVMMKDNHSLYFAFITSRDPCQWHGITESYSPTIPTINRQVESVSLAGYSKQKPTRDGKGKRDISYVQNQVPSL
jgi:hypothetical protein